MSDVKIEGHNDLRRSKKVPGLIDNINVEASRSHSAYRNTNIALTKEVSELKSLVNALIVKQTGEQNVTTSID